LPGPAVVIAQAPGDERRRGHGGRGCVEDDDGVGATSSSRMHHRYFSWHSCAPPRFPSEQGERHAGVQVPRTVEGYRRQDGGSTVGVPVRPVQPLVLHQKRTVQRVATV
jgi:hypothetical protein